MPVSPIAAKRSESKSLTEILTSLSPAETVKVDVERLAAEPSISPRITVSGYAYDVATGLLATVVPPRPRVAA
jgi:carbonic anhydrase